VVVPPIGRLLDLILAHLQIGGCFRPGNRFLADGLGYSGASQIPALLQQLACQGWIAYDPETRLITLLRDYRSDRSIRSIDQGDESAPSDEKRSIDPIDREIPQSEAEQERAISSGSPKSQCMESLVTTTSTKSPVVVVDSEGGDARGGDSAARVMAELGANWKIIKDAFAARADWTAPQVRARWEYDQRRIAASEGRLNEGIFFAALRAGQLAPPRPDPDRPIDPAAYADKPGYALGSNLAPPGDAESIRDHASRLLPPPTAATIREHTRDWIFLQGRLAQGDSDEAALQALEARRSAVRR